MKNVLMLAASLVPFLSVSAGNNETKRVPEKIITITLLPGGTAVVGTDSLDFAELTKELQQRLFRSYLGTGKMYDAIKIQTSAEVLMDTRDAAKDAIRKAQQNALKQLCLEKHKKLFEDITSKQQDKIRKQFPVLFQTNFD